MARTGRSFPSHPKTAQALLAAVVFTGSASMAATGTLTPAGAKNATGSS